MAMRIVLLVVAVSAVCFAEPPSSKESGIDGKDKRGAVSYETDSYASHGAAVALPASASLGYAGLGHSPLLLQGGGLGLLSPGLGYGAPLALGHGLALGGHGLALGGHGVPLASHGVALGGHGLALGGHGLALGGHGLALGGHGVPLASHGLALGGHGLALGGHGLAGHGLALGAQPIVLGAHGLSGLSLGGYGLGVPSLATTSIKLSPSVISSSSDYHHDHHDTYSGPSLTNLSPPSKSYGVPSTSSYSSGFQPSSSYSGSSSSYSAPSSSYGSPSSSYGPPSSSYGLPSSSNSGDYSTLSYSSGSHSPRDYRSHHSH